jgi:hypothetical protein
VNEETIADSDAGNVSLSSTLKPSTAGLSFAIKPEAPGKPVSMKALISCATYLKFAVDDKGKEIPSGSANKAIERWRRVPQSASISLILDVGEKRINLSEFGIPGLELYILVTPVSDLLTVTAALSN